MRGLLALLGLAAGLGPHPKHAGLLANKRNIPGVETVPGEQIRVFRIRTEKYIFLDMISYYLL